MEPHIELTYQEYESLVYLSREGARLKGFMEAVQQDPRLRHLAAAAHEYGYQDTAQTRNLEEFLQNVEKQNGIKRYFVAVRWQELDAPLPPRVAGAATRFPENWPPNLQGTLELLTRPICRADVDAYLARHASKPTCVMVTTDPALLVGWSPIDGFFR